jgi:HlyD family secretion protein
MRCAMNKKTIVIVAAVVVVGVIWGVGARDAVRREVLLSIDAAPFVESAEMRGEVDTLFYEELRAPRGRYTKQLIYLHPEGSEVSEGDLIAELDTAELLQHIDELREGEAGLRQRRLDTDLATKAEIFSREVLLEKAQDELDIAGITLIRMQHEADKRRAIAESKYNNVKRQVMSAQKRLKQLEFDRSQRLSSHDRRIEHSGKRIRRVESEIEDYRFHATRDSIVVYPVAHIAGIWKKAQEGDVLAQNSEFARLPDFSSKVIRVYLEEQWVNRIREQSEVIFRPISIPGSEYRGKVLSVATLAKEGHFISYKKFFEVIISIDDTDEEAADKLKPGMVCDVSFLIRDWGTILAIPKDYTRKTQDGDAYVIVRDEPDGKDETIMLKDIPETVDFFLLAEERERLIVVYEEI